MTRELTADLCAFWAEQLSTLSPTWRRKLLDLLAGRYGLAGAERIYLKAGGHL